MMLYHQTSPAKAREILRQGTMLRGQDGIIGGGIYFAVTEEDTHFKATHRGAILTAWVRLGRVKRISSHHSSHGHTTFSSLQNEGFDSVYTTFLRTGPEYVVYNYDQVTPLAMDLL
jgi:hypothetical protein